MEAPGGQDGRAGWFLSQYGLQPCIIERVNVNKLIVPRDYPRNFDTTKQSAADNEENVDELFHTTD